MSIKQLRDFLSKEGFGLDHCIRALGTTGDGDPHVAVARKRHNPRDIMFDKYVVQSETQGGCYVLGWMYVDDEDTEGVERSISPVSQDGEPALEANEAQNVLRVLNVSTSHLTEEEASTFGDSEGEVQIGRARRNMADDRGYGVMVYVVDEDMYDPEEDGTASEGLQAVIDHAIKGGFGYIWFDRDADPLEGARSYEW